MTWQLPDPVSGYRPILPPEHIEQIERWHERAYRAGRAEGASGQTFDYPGTTIVVPPDVMPITPMSHLLGEAVLAEAGPGERVLDMGCGSGVNAILAATRGAEVLAVDINPKALEAAKANVVRNGLLSGVEVRQSDVFDNVDGVFDLIVFDPPFRWFRPRSLFESASTDEGYRAMTRFFRQATGHLTQNGRMLIFFGTSGDLDYLLNLIAREGFAAESIARDDLVRDGWRVEYFRFRVTQAPKRLNHRNCRDRSRVPPKPAERPGPGSLKGLARVVLGARFVRYQPRAAGVRESVVVLARRERAWQHR